MITDEDIKKALTLSVVAKGKPAENEEWPTLYVVTSQVCDDCGGDVEVLGAYWNEEDAEACCDSPWGHSHLAFCARQKVIEVPTPPRAGEKAGEDFVSRPKKGKTG